MKTYIIDSFISSPFRGNPAGICMVRNSLTHAFMPFQSSEPSGFMEVEMSSLEKLLVKGNAVLTFEGTINSTHNGSN